MTEYDIIADFSKKTLTEVPENVTKMFNLKMLYLEGNFIEYLPDNIFTKLPQLNWLDLRNNKLRSLPKSIAYHENLENLLLTNNRLEKLPNELGLAPKLKVLQVSQNPLLYPCRSIITDGVQAICAYLRSQYLAENSKEGEGDTASKPDADRLTVVSDTSIGTSEAPSEYRDGTSQTIVSRIHAKPKRGHSEPTPIITVTSLSRTKSKIESSSEQIAHKNDRIVHEITRGPSEISLKSYYEDKEPTRMKGNTQLTVSDAQLKQEWLSKIRDVLIEQERILQQEKNLMALKEWRDERRLESPRTVEPKDYPKPPFDVQEEYMTMPSRIDLLNDDIDKYVQKETNTPRQMNIERLIGELMNQLKELEDKCADVRSPKQEIEEAARQIRMITSIHQKIQNLQDVNAKSML